MPNKFFYEAHSGIYDSCMKQDSYMGPATLSRTQIYQDSYVTEIV